MSNSLQPVDFHGDILLVIEHNGEPYTPMRLIVEGMGLEWGAQQQKLQANKERWSISMIDTVAKDGKRRDVLCMPVRKLPSYLSTVNPKKVKASIRQKIITYQNECDDALWNYWSKGLAIRKSAADDIRSILTKAVEAIDPDSVNVNRIKLMHYIDIANHVINMSKHIVSFEGLLKEIVQEMEAQGGRKLII